MTISYVSAGNTIRANNGNINADLPLGSIAGDIFICAITSLDNVNSTMPSGWIVIYPGTNNGTGLRTTVYYKIAAAGDTDPQVTHNGGSRIVATMVSYRGVDPTNPLDVTGITRVNTSSTTVTATSITTISNNDLVIFAGCIASNSTFSSYSGTPTPTERVDTQTSNYPSIFVTDFAMTSAGSTGNRTAIATNASVNNGLMFALRPSTATIICITDPSGAYIYIDGVLQPSLTSGSISVQIGTHTVIFSKAGYYSYTENVTLTPNQIVKISAILVPMVNITAQGIVICTSSNIATCPTSPIDCATQIIPSSYVNFIAVLNSASSTTLTVRFFYSVNGVSNYRDAYVTIPIGTSTVYAFPTNQQYSPDTILSLDDVSLV